MFYLYVVLTGLWGVYLLSFRLWLFRHVGYKYEPATLIKFKEREDFVMMTIMGFLVVLGSVSTADLFFHFL